MVIGTAPLEAQSPSSSSNGQGASSQDSRSTPAPRIAQPEAGGSAITLETSESLFYLAAALNTCGYDADLNASAPVRAKIREEINQTLTASAEAREARKSVCAYILRHTLTDSGRNLAQYVSLAAYLKPPPELTPGDDVTELPPDATQVVTILPLLRTFGETVHLHSIWIRHRPDYEDLVNRVHDPLTRMLLNTNIYLGLPVSSYDGRRFLVLLEPLLAPSATNARIYANDFLVVASPGGNPLGSIHMDQVRHTYLHYEIEPLVYARAGAMERLQPLLKGVQEAPIEFVYKSDIVALITECLIKAVEARTMDVGHPRPVRPTGTKQRAELALFDAENAAYEKQAENVRRQNVQLAVRQGWVLADYFYDKLGALEHDSISLKEDIGEMVYGMDVQRELHKDKQVVFLHETSHDLLRRTPIRLQGLDLAEVKLMEGDTDGAEQMARDALQSNPEDPKANYLAGRIELVQGNPEGAFEHLTKALTLTKDPGTLAWTHIYLGRLWDIARDPEHPDTPRPERPKAIAEYKAALDVPGGQSDTKVAAEKGLKEPFTLPRRDPQTADPDDAPLDPSGRAEKDAYRPAAPDPSTTPPR